MKLAILSHCAMDTITIGEKSFEQIGGPPCYGGLTARNLKFDVELFTKFGHDFPTSFLKESKISFDNSRSEKKTTRFRIDINGSERTLRLENVCEPIDFTESDADAFLISPIFNEIKKTELSKSIFDSKFTLIDPQGFLRYVDENRRVFLSYSDIDLTKISAIKLNPAEANALVGGSDIESLKKLVKSGIKYVILTNKIDVSMLVGDKLYSLTLPNKEIYDTTGIGDIFCSTFACTMVKEKDFLWAICFAGGSAQAALDNKEIGLLKVPKKGAIETNASYFYNTINFKQV
ncbi:MAG: ribokinase [Nitrosopumilaceae archaeon]|nr:ribokinase [Nitrosopumilaceae archaeon]NIU02629.1 ribokinase [Nitrosopumilaceae archaeon]NIU89092.1 ribokinase [Nitrosopumilaceae archaeon]NIV67195.1 ribokinase [Nitrosopumilaceae archaeon]NIX63230.1 ribokinase [Nitrosopumilaceae archaeon]